MTTSTRSAKELAADARAALAAANAAMGTASRASAAFAAANVAWRVDPNERTYADKQKSATFLCTAFSYTSLGATLPPPYAWLPPQTMRGGRNLPMSSLLLLRPHGRRWLLDRRCVVLRRLLDLVPHSVVYSGAWTSKTFWRSAKPYRS